jgi:hypothetical protein
MLNKLRGALVVGATVAASFGAAGVAAADDAGVQEVAPEAVDVQGVYDNYPPNNSLLYALVGNVNAGNETCWAPWNWDGPGNAGRLGNISDYEACENPIQNEYPPGVNILNNSCVAPWLWEGPLNIGQTGNTKVYRACNQQG